MKYFCFTVIVSIFLLSCNEITEVNHGITTSSYKFGKSKIKINEFFIGEDITPTEAQELFKDDFDRLSSTPSKIDNDTLSFDYSLQSYSIDSEKFLNIIESIPINDSIYFEFGIEKHPIEKENYHFYNFTIYIGSANFNQSKWIIGNNFYNLGNGIRKYDQSLKNNLLKVYGTLNNLGIAGYDITKNFGGVVFERSQIKDWLIKHPSPYYYFYPVYDKSKKSTTVVITTSRIIVIHNQKGTTILGKTDFENRGTGCCP